MAFWAGVNELKFFPLELFHIFQTITEVRKRLFIALRWEMNGREVGLTERVEFRDENGVGVEEV